MQLTNERTSATTSRSAGSKLGNKIGGVVETVHGVGESLRGNAMSVLDEATGTRRGRTQNDQVAEHGRLEMREGMERMGRRGKVNVLPPSSSTPYPEEPARHEHHRDDAIMGLPSRQGGQNTTNIDQGLEYV